MGKMDDFDKTLTPAERSAPTFLEWSDETLARGVRALAAKLHDSVGFHGITGMAAGLALEKVARDNNVTEYRITIGGETRIMVRLPNKDMPVKHGDTPQPKNEENDDSGGHK